MFPIIVFIVNMILTSPYINSKFQKCKSKFRFSLHTLTTETGRYMKTKRLQETTVKDEYHNNLFCLIYDNFRRSYFRDTIGGRGGTIFYVLSQKMFEPEYYKMCSLSNFICWSMKRCTNNIFVILSYVCT